MRTAGCNECEQLAERGRHKRRPLFTTRWQRTSTNNEPYMKNKNNFNDMFLKYYTNITIHYKQSSCGPCKIGARFEASHEYKQPVGIATSLATILAVLCHVACSEHTYFPSISTR